MVRNAIRAWNWKRAQEEQRLVLRYIWQSQARLGLEKCSRRASGKGVALDCMVWVSVRVTKKIVEVHGKAMGDGYGRHCWLYNGRQTLTLSWAIEVKHT